MALTELVRSLERPTIRQLTERVTQRERVTDGESGASAVRAEREVR
jgi:hypothetical protein